VLVSEAESLSLDIQFKRQTLINKTINNNKTLEAISEKIVTGEKEFEAGNEHWKTLRSRENLPSKLNVSFPNWVDLDRAKVRYSTALRKEGGNRNVIVKSKILEDWISAINSDNPEISQKLTEMFLRSANVVGATCTHAGNREFLKLYSEFDVVIVDEVSKATPTELLIPCLLGKKVILVGDHMQLPPIFGEDSCFLEAAEMLEENKEELENKLKTSLFKERYNHLVEVSDTRTSMLTLQYRMHPHIMEAINQFYNYELQAGPGLEKLAEARQHGISLGGWLPTNCHIVWIDLPQDDKWKHTQEGGSRKNALEAELVLKILNQIIAQLKNHEHEEVFEIGVTSVYAAQTNLIKKMFEPDKTNLSANVKLKISTVDKFQGMEKDIMIVSLVVNNPNTNISEFLRTPERINVAFSRARRLLIVVGSTYNYVSKPSDASEKYGKVLDVAKKKGKYVGVYDVLG
jgi:superfamily I DNA and/or RNA helicase